MRLPRVRFTVRRMMIAVAVIAALMGGLVAIARMRHRQHLFSQYYACLSEAHERREFVYLNSQLGLQKAARSFEAMSARDSYAEGEAARCRAWAEAQGRVAEHEDAMKRRRNEAEVRGGGPPLGDRPSRPARAPGRPGVRPGSGPLPSDPREDVPSSVPGSPVNVRR